MRLDRRALGAIERLEEALFMGLRLTEGLDLAVACIGDTVLISGSVTGKT